MSTNTFRTHMYGKSADERRALLDKIEAARVDARDNWDDPAWHKEMAREMTEVLYEGFQHESLLDLMAEVETVGEGDRITIKEVRGLRVHWISRGGSIDQSTIDAEEAELVEDFVGFHVSENEDKMRANFPENQAAMVDLAIQQMDAEINLRLLRLYQAAIPDATHDSYVTSAGVDLDTLNSAIRGVSDETLLEYPVIVGRASMIDQVFDEVQSLGLLAPETNEDLIRLGVIGRYKGCRLIRLRNFKDRNKNSFFPQNELYILGRDAAKFGFWGGLTAKEWIEEGGYYWHYMGRRSAGGAVHRPERARRYVDSSLTA